MTNNNKRQYSSRTMKGHGFFRKHKAVKGLATGIALAGVVIATQAQTAYANEVTTPSTTDVVLTDNNATNLVSVQESNETEHAALMDRSGQQTGEITAPVISSSLNGAISTAEAAGVNIVDTKEVSHSELITAQADLDRQEVAVDKAVEVKETVSATLAENTEAAKKAGVIENSGEKKTYRDDTEAALKDAKEQAGRVDVAVKTQVEVNATLPEAVRKATDKGLTVKGVTLSGDKVDFEKSTDFSDSKAAIDNLTKQTADLEKATTVHEEANALIDQAVDEAKKKGTEVSTSSSVQKVSVSEAKAVAQKQTEAIALVVAENEKKKVAYDKALAEYQTALDTYNRLLGEYNEAVKVSEATKAQNAEIDKANAELNQAIERLNAAIKSAVDTKVKENTTERFTATSNQTGTVKVNSAADANTKGQEIINGLTVVGGTASGSEVPADAKAAYEQAMAIYNQKKSAQLARLRSGDGVKLELREVSEGLVSSFSGAEVAEAGDSETKIFDGYSFSSPVYTDDGTGLVNGKFFEQGNYRLRINSTSSYDDATGEGVIVLNSITVESFEVTTNRPNAAALKDHGYVWKSPDGREIYRYATQEGSTGVMPVNVTYPINQTIRLKPGQKSAWVYAGINDPYWIEEAPSRIYLRMSYDPSMELLVPPTAPTPVSFAGGGGTVNYSLLEAVPRPRLASPSVPDEPTAPTEPTKPTYAKAIATPLSVETEAQGIQMTVATHLIDLEVSVHPVSVDQKPTNVKAVVNEDGTDVSGKLVAKNETVAWVLSNGILKAGRPEVTSYTLKDPFPADFIIDETVGSDWSSRVDETGTRYFSLTAKAIENLNLNLGANVSVPELRVLGRPVNDGGTYSNTFETIIETKNKDGKTSTYTVVSNTPVIYTPGSQNRTYNGEVVVRYFNEDGTIKIASNVSDVENGKVGSLYDTTDNKPQTIAYEGNLYELTTKVVGNETGDVVQGTIFVDYFYKLVPSTPTKGSVVVHYVDEEGNTIKSDVVDLLDDPVGNDYDTKDNRPDTIKATNGVDYVRTEVVHGNETGKVVEGVTEVTYVYKRVTPKPETPTPNDNLIKPMKDVVDENSNSIDGKSVLPNSILNYVAKHDLDQYKGMVSSKSAIAKGFLYVDDYLDEALDGKSMMVKAIKAANGDDVSSLLEMHHVLSVDALNEKLQALIKDSGISPVGEFYMWVAKEPEKFFEAYVQKGLDITYNLSFKIKQGFVGDITNQTFQVDFGNGYYGNVVKNILPSLAIKKDVLDKDGKSIDGKEVAFGDEIKYKLEGWVIPVDRGYDVWEYRFVDSLQVSHDEYQSYKVYTKVDFEYKGKTYKAGDEIDFSEVTHYSYDKRTGLFELNFNKDFLQSISREQAFGVDVQLQVKRIAYGEVVNEYKLYINGNEVISNKVTTFTPQPPAPKAEPKPTTPGQQTTPGQSTTPETPAVKTLPNTGEASGILVSVSGAFSALLGLFGLFKRKKD